jgi:hypothetical protein
MEEGGVDGIAELIAPFFASLMATIDGIPAHFVLNMDETSHQDWADCEVFLPVSPARADKSSFKSAVIIPRKVVDSDIITTGLISEKFDVDKQPKGFGVTELFDSWFETACLPELSTRRTKFGTTSRLSCPLIAALCIQAIPVVPHDEEEEDELEAELYREQCACLLFESNDLAE